MKKTAVNGVIRLASLYALFAAIVLSGSQSIAQPHEPERQSAKDRLSREARDAWISGKLESAYIFNEHLNPFDIEISVESGIVTLEGAVESDIKKDLAGHIAEGIDGVHEVDNQLEVRSERDNGNTRANQRSSSNDFGQWVGDATTTAVVKTKLAANEHIHSLDINVETRDGVVTLSGAVDSPEVRELAETVTRNVDRVEKVDNRITIQ